MMFCSSVSGLFHCVECKTGKISATTGEDIYDHVKDIHGPQTNFAFQHEILHEFTGEFVQKIHDFQMTISQIEKTRKGRKVVIDLTTEKPRIRFKRQREIELEDFQQENDSTVPEIVVSFEVEPRVEEAREEEARMEEPVSRL